MNKTKSLAAQAIGAAAIVMLVGTSAFAETRHRDATERDNSRQSDHRESRDSNRDSRDSNRQSRERDNRSNQGQTWQRGDSRSTSPQTFERRDFRSNSPQTYQRGETRGYGQNYGQNYGQTYSRGNTQYDRRTQADSYRNNRGGFDNNPGSLHRSPTFPGHRSSLDSRFPRKRSARSKPPPLLWKPPRMC